MNRMNKDVAAKRRNYIILWIAVQSAWLIVPLIIGAVSVRYQISYDEHMVNTVNERAMNYTADNGTVTDFSRAEILKNDADLKYEERVWMLEHRELYWIYTMSAALLFGGLAQLFNFLWKGNFDLNDKYEWW